MISIFYSLKNSKSKLPLVNPRKAFELSSARIKKEFIRNAPDIFEKGFALTGNKPFRVIADIGEVIILPPDLANEVRNDTRLSFSKFMYEVRNICYAGVIDVDLRTELSCPPSWIRSLHRRRTRHSPCQTRLPEAVDLPFKYAFTATPSFT